MLTPLSLLYTSTLTPLSLLYISVNSSFSPLHIYVNSSLSLSFNTSMLTPLSCSSDSGTVGNVVILAEGLVLEHPDDFYRMQVSLLSPDIVGACKLTDSCWGSHQALLS